MRPTLFILIIFAAHAAASMTCGDIKAIWKNNDCCGAELSKETCLQAITKTEIEEMTAQSNVFETLTCAGDMEIKGKVQVDGELELCSDIIPCPSERRRLGDSIPHKINLFAKIQELEDRIAALESKIST